MKTKTCIPLNILKPLAEFAGVEDSRGLDCVFVNHLESGTETLTATDGRALICVRNSSGTAYTDKPCRFMIPAAVIMAASRLKHHEDNLEVCVEEKRGSFKISYWANVVTYDFDAIRDVMVQTDHILSPVAASVESAPHLVCACIKNLNRIMKCAMSINKRMPSHAKISVYGRSSTPEDERPMYIRFSDKNIIACLMPVKWNTDETVEQSFSHFSK